MSERPSPTVSVRAFSHVGMSVVDLDRSVAFYTAVLGFRIQFEIELESWKRVGLSLDDVVLELFSPHPIGQPLDPIDMLYPAPYGRPKIALTVTDVDAAYEALTAAGVPTIGPVHSTGVSKLIFVLDPDGTIIQLHQFDDGYPRVIDMVRA
jgi:catechol 2,3-dioxygenase-like lactoylglutathione lyase family enzyme